MTKKRRITVYLLAILFALSVSFMFIAAFNQSNAVFAASIFEYDGKVKTVAGDEDGGKRGLRLFAYDSGATANFKGVQTDIFQSEIKIASFGGNSNLRKYSLRFKDEKSGKSFSVQVSSYSDYNDIGVIYNGAKGGIVYHEASNLPYGVTAGYNEQSVYTKFTADICSLTFDPESMQVKIKGDDGNYRLVWDFTKQYNDGKLIESDLEPFAEYSVAVVFDEIAANSRGDLLLCSFGGYSLAESNVEYRPAIILSSEIKPVLNKNYVFPSAKTTSENGADVSDKIVASLYDENGKLLAKNVKNYTPAEKGTLYLYYEYSENGGTSDAWYKTEVIEQSEITEKFVYAADLPETVGLNAKVYVPDASVITNILASGREECFVTVKKDGKVVSGYEKIDGDFYLKVTETGVYEIEYSGKKSGEYNKEIKRITVDDGILAVNIDDIPDSFAVGSTYEFPSAEFYLGDETAVVTAKIITPYGEQKSGEITFSEVGKYTLDYTAVLGGENRNCSKDIFVKHKITDDFDTDASYSSMKSNNETTGVKLTLTDNKTITYGKTIDLSEYTFNDKTNNGKTLLEVSFDPKNIGSTDLDSFFVVLTDKYDSTNWTTIYENERSMGGCIWEWCDHAYYAGNKKDFYFGGDGNEWLHDGNFCADGMLRADRDLTSAAYEIANVYRPFYSELFGNELTITSRLSFTGSEKYEIECKVIKDGKTAEVALDHDIKPLKTQKFNLSETLCGENVFVELTYKHNGKTCGSEQHVVKRTLPVIAQKQGGDIKVTENTKFYIFDCGNVKYYFSKHTATFEKIEKDGKNYLSDKKSLLYNPYAAVNAFVPNIYRYKMDNDMYINGKWREHGFDMMWNRVLSYNVEKVGYDYKITVDSLFSSPKRSKEFTNKFVYTIFANGDLGVDCTLTREIDNLPYLPRYGFLLNPNENLFDKVEWEGFGPNENYSDYKEAAKVGVYSKDIKDMFYEYVSPQENGERCGISYLSLSGKNGAKLSVYAKGDFFSFKVNDFIGKDLLTARHITDLKRGETLELAIDGYFSGVGSNSCGPELPEDKRVTDKVLQFGVYFRFE